MNTGIHFFRVYFFMLVQVILFNPRKSVHLQM